MLAKLKRKVTPMFDFYDQHKFICLVTLFLTLVCGASLWEGNLTAASVTGLAALGLGAYLYQLYKQK